MREFNEQCILEIDLIDGCASLLDDNARLHISNRTCASRATLLLIVLNELKTMSVLHRRERKKAEYNCDKQQSDESNKDSEIISATYVFTVLSPTLLHFQSDRPTGMHSHLFLYIFSCNNIDGNMLTIYRYMIYPYLYAYNVGCTRFNKV